MSCDLVHETAQLTGVAVLSATALSGGSLSPVMRLNLADGRTAVAKGGPAPAVEAAMLTRMREAGAPCPAVIAVSGRCLVLEDLGDEAALSPKAEAMLGAVLARMHETAGDAYGWDQDYAFASLPITNAPMPNWPEFWAERRLLATLDRAPAPLAHRVEALARALPDRLPARPRASLLHGDLWSGNVFADTRGGVWLIDPACYHGHDEVDLAMLGLFGAPSPAFFEGYGAVEPGAVERRPVYQLWPALVHLHLFGGGYAGLVDRLLGQAGF